MSDIDVSALTQKIAKRIHSCDKLFEVLRKYRAWPSGVYLNFAVLENAVEHYFRELGATKTKHCIDNADAHKRAAFTLKWMVRLRPIQIERGVIVDKTDILLANEIFAAYVALEHLRLSFDDVDHKWLFNLLYTLRYRDFNAETMASEMYLLESRSAAIQ